MTAFGLFGKHRREDEPADQLLAAATAGAREAEAEPAPSVVDELLLPRWRRPSLQQARCADPLRATAERSRLSFESAGVRPLENYERRQIGYRLVRLLDSPDEFRSPEIGILDEGDEVQLLQRCGAYWLVLCPDGRQGWLHRMTLAEPAEAAGVEVGPEPMPPYQPGDETPEPARSAGEHGPDGLLEAYLRARSISCEP